VAIHKKKARGVDWGVSGEKGKTRRGLFVKPANDHLFFVTEKGQWRLQKNNYSFIRGKRKGENGGGNQDPQRSKKE